MARQKMFAMQEAPADDSKETERRRCALMFHGIEEQPGDIREVVINLILSLNVRGFTPVEVISCNRLGKEPGEQRRRPRPVVVFFRYLNIRDDIWLVKRNLRGSGIRITEFLTVHRFQIFRHAIRHFGEDNCWSHEGNIIVQTSDHSKYQIYPHMRLIQASPREPSSSSKLRVSKRRH